MSPQPGGRDDVAQEADRVALPATGRVLLYLAGVLGIAVFIIGLVGNLGVGISALVAVIIALVIVVAFLWNGRDYLIGAALTARNGEDAARQDASASKAEAIRLTPFEGRVAEQSRDLDALRQQNTALTDSLNQAQAENERLRARAVGAESQVATLTGETQRLGTELTAERNNTARAPYLPELRPTVEVKGFGVLSAKTVQVKVENVGRGNALNVQVSALLVSPGRPDRLIPLGVIPILTPRQVHYSVVGDMNQLAGVTRVEGRLWYESQFGPCRPMAHRVAL